MISYEGCVGVSFGIYILTCYILEYLRPFSTEERVPDKKGTIALSVSNLLLGSSLLLNLRSYIQLSSETHVPGVLLQVLSMLLIADALFYGSHRLLHVPWIYQRYHKLHHRHVSPISWTALYVHPGEFLSAFIGFLHSLWDSSFQSVSTQSHYSSFGTQS